jgi:chemotaxis protein methyltransferase CheR
MAEHDVPSPLLTMSDFTTVQDMVKSACGINLHQGKKALVASRLEKLVRAGGFGTFADYIRFISRRRHGAEFTEFIDTLTTNHTGFWREPEHFAYLQNTFFQQRRGRVRIWSAACATGEEPYTVAMCALSAGVTNPHIVASDISTAALKTAIKGEYDEARVAPLPAGWRQRFLEPIGASGPFRVSPEVRALVSFASLNLLQPFSDVGHFDAILCRNVMIYFDQMTRDAVVARLLDQLVPGGLLFTGHSETLLRLPVGVEYVRPATYRKV